jgi:hypothetical protein
MSLVRPPYHTVFVLRETAETNKAQQALQICRWCVPPIQKSSEAEITVSVFMLARSELVIQREENVYFVNTIAA